VWCVFYAFRKLNRKQHALLKKHQIMTIQKTGNTQSLNVPNLLKNPKQSESFSESKMANALASDGAWVGGTVIAY